MANDIPTVIAVRAALKGFAYSHLDALSRLSGVPFHTLRKIRDGETANPGIETVRKFWPHVAQAAPTQEAA